MIDRAEPILTEEAIVVQYQGLPFEIPAGTTILGRKESWETAKEFAAWIKKRYRSSTMDGK